MVNFAAQYEHIKLLGEGSFGTAYLVRDKQNAIIRVAKEIRIAHLSEQQRRAALAEAEVLRMMSHSNIIAYVATFMENSKLHILMEYADGGDLAARIKARREDSRRFLEHEVMFIFVQLSLALAHVHARNILHRDIKPLNVFLTRHGVVKLGDFGIARVLESATAGAQTMIGTPHYLSPEICNNERYGTKSDLWSLGVVLYELAALHVPFQAVSLPAVVMRICSMKPDPLPDSFSQDLCTLVFGLLEKEPKQRPYLESMLRSSFVQQHAQNLLSYSLGRNSGGCESMLSDGVGNVTPSPNASSEHRRTENVGQHRVSHKVEVPQAPTISENHRDAVREEFFMNRNAALQAKRRAELGEFRISDAVPGNSPAVPNKASPVVEEGSGQSRVAEVRRRAQEERDRRDAARKQELEQAMREVRKDKRAAKESRLSRESSIWNRESNPSHAHVEKSPVLSKVSVFDAPSPEKDGGVNVLNLQAFQEELIEQTKQRQNLMERNMQACFAPQWRPLEHDIIAKNVKHSPDKSDLQTTIMPPAEDVDDCGVTLKGTSHFVPVPAELESGLDNTDVHMLQEVLASAIDAASCKQVPTCHGSAGFPSVAQDVHCINSDLQESTPLEYTLSTEACGTLRSLHEVFDVGSEEETMHLGSKLPRLDEAVPTPLAAWSTCEPSPVSHLANCSDTSLRSVSKDLAPDDSLPMLPTEVMSPAVAALVTDTGSSSCMVAHPSGVPHGESANLPLGSPPLSSSSVREPLQEVGSNNDDCLQPLASSSAAVMDEATQPLDRLSVETVEASVIALPEPDVSPADFIADQEQTRQSESVEDEIRNRRGCKKCCLLM